MRYHRLLVALADLFPDNTSVLRSNMLRNDGFGVRSDELVLHNLAEPASSSVLRQRTRSEACG